MGSRINEPFQQLINGAGYDHCYVLNKRETEALVFMAKCVEPKADVRWKFIPQSRVQKHTQPTGTMVSLDTTVLHSRQEVPSALKHSTSPTHQQDNSRQSLKPKDTYHQVTIYKFGVEKKSNSLINL